MQSTDRVEFVQILNGLAAIKRVQLTAESLSVWWLAMQTWSIEDFRNAAGLLVKSCQFMPTPYDFEQLRKAARPTAGEAWERAIAACPGWRNGSASVDPLTDRVVQMLGGYRHLAMESLDTQHFTARRFAELYEQLDEREAVREAVPQIAGPPTTPRLTAGTFRALGYQPDDAA